ncbi:hypothetical protein SAMN05444273_101507 [Litoreibacter ascidiaceicola]|uniref:Uncharacterized protein n=1 Tax=Litoreibacter ascidiaceicola TaxID=1486859 RepID=A0A1M4TRA1_9RHOB|nr:hypothetical protein [Litoreibacter ascidiaceicola]SHE46915.1 hypothetical protein SAMN05444273_101507 [Litoreibacter ascidiaceicola]
MSETKQDNLKRYSQAYDKDEKFFHGAISDTESKAFEYGVLVVQKSILVAGGALLAIPTLMSLSASGQVDKIDAAIAGASFAAALLVAILSAYVIHLNWMFHSEAWRAHWTARQTFLKEVYLEGRKWDEALEDDKKPRLIKRIDLTFRLPHILAITYLILITYGFFRFYLAFGVFG